MTSFRKYMSVVFSIALLAGCGSASSAAATSAPSASVSAEPSAEPAAETVQPAELSEDAAIALMAQVDPTMPSFSFRWFRTDEYLFTVPVYEDPEGYEGKFQEALVQENNALKDTLQKASALLNSAELEAVDMDQPDYSLLQYTFDLNDDNHSSVALYQNGIVQTYSDAAGLRYYNCEDIGEILYACSQGASQYMAINDQQIKDLYVLKFHAVKADPEGPVTELDETGITALLKVLRNEELGFFGADVSDEIVTDLPAGADRNLDYQSAEGFTSKDELKSFAMTYLPEEYLTDFDQRVIEYNGQVLIGRGAMGWGNDLFNPYQWEMADEETVHVQFISGGETVHGAYAKVHFRKDGDHWIIDTLEYPGYDSASGWQNPQ